jgi:hypothetical protein
MNFNKMKYRLWLIVMGLAAGLAGRRTAHRGRGPQLGTDQKSE